MVKGYRLHIEILFEHCKPIAISAVTGGALEVSE